jgi:perosamine synthetase
MIPLNEPYLAGREWEYIKECLDTNWVSSAGKYVTRFEEQIAEYLGIQHSVAVVNGTAALHLALKVLGVTGGDRVLVPSLTFIASVNPIRYCGAEPVFVDSSPATFGMDPLMTVAKIEELIKRGEKPKAVLVVHLYGHPVEMAPIIEVCRKHQISLVEDATEALGSKYRGQMVGTLGDIGCFSFNGNKLITTGGGGMLVSHHQGLMEKVKYLSQQAKDDPERMYHENIGYNYRLTNIQAALGVAQLEQIVDFLSRKKEIARRYNEELGGLSGITVNPEQEWADNCFWLYSILVDTQKAGITSADLIKHLREKEIESRSFFWPIHRLPMYEGCEATAMTQTDQLWREGVNLPSSVGLSAEQVAKVIATIKEVVV